MRPELIKTADHVMYTAYHMAVQLLSESPVGVIWIADATKYRIVPKISIDMKIAICKIMILTPIFRKLYKVKQICNKKICSNYWGG